MSRWPSAATCTVEGCERPVYRRDLCSMHAGRLRRLGRLTLPTFEDKFWARVDMSSSCWEWTGSKNQRGYGVVSHDGRMQLCHRVVWQMRFEKIPDGIFVLHHCDNPGCVNPDHLFLGTHLDNMRDMDRKGRRVNSNCKLTNADVRTIRASSEMQSHLAKRYGISPSVISRIKGGKLWKHVSDAEDEAIMALVRGQVAVT